MRVLHFSKYDRRGGAAIAALNSVRAQRALGLDAQMVVGRKESGEAFVFGPASGPARLACKLAFAAERIPFRMLGVSRFDVRSIGLPGRNIAAIVKAHDPDIVVLHNVDGLVPLGALPDIGRPVIWRMHDMWPATGTRHYDDGQLLRGLASRLEGWVRRRKRIAYRRTPDLTFCPPSHWLAEVVKASPLTCARACEVVPNGIDIGAFKPDPSGSARQALGIAPGGRVIAFGASGGVGDPRKGGDLLHEALRIGADRLKAAGGHLLVFGGGGEMFAGLGIPLTTLDQRASGVGMAEVYQAADLLVAPSRMENLSLTVLEAMACATPVVAFRVGGMPDMIENGATGWLADQVSPEALLDTLLGALSQLKEDRAVGLRARAEIERRFSLDVEARLMRGLFERSLVRTGRTPVPGAG